VKVVDVHSSLAQCSPSSSCVRTRVKVVDVHSSLAECSPGSPCVKTRVNIHDWPQWRMFTRVFGTVVDVHSSFSPGCSLDSGLTQSNRDLPHSISVGLAMYNGVRFLLGFDDVVILCIGFYSQDFGLLIFILGLMSHDLSGCRAVSPVVADGESPLLYDSGSLWPVDPVHHWLRC
jgi:hypothetical protein